MKRTLPLVAALGLIPTLGFWFRPAPSPEVETRPNTGYLDMHVHAACMDREENGCYLSPEMRHGYKFPFYLRAFDVTLEELRNQGDGILLRKLSEKISASERVSRAVVLALDGVVGSDGRLDLDRTQVHVPNEYLAKELARYDNLLFGASINPYRPDALQRLEQAKRDGAVLLKWIPGIMDIDPADAALVPFYDRLRDLGLPLLSHAGQEGSFGASNDDLGDPQRLQLPLRRGVTVIAAHVASTGLIGGQDNFDRLLPLFARYRNLYADVSSLTQINRRGYLVRALSRGDVRGRLLYGSDWPLQFFPLVSPWYQLDQLSLSQIRRIRSIANQWDRDVALKEAMGVPAEVFEGSATLVLGGAAAPGAGEAE